MKKCCSCILGTGVPGNDSIDISRCRTEPAQHHSVGRGGIRLEGIALSRRAPSIFPAVVQGTLVFQAAQGCN